MTTGIEWTDETWNPVRGCTRVSEGCRHCYAESWAAKRLSGPGQAYYGLVRNTQSGPRWTGKVACVAERLPDPLRWQLPKAIFVNSMGDLFHEQVPEAFVDRVFAVMAVAERHVFQILTKRPERQRDYFNTPGRALRVARLRHEYDIFLEERARPMPELVWPPPNVLAGVSVEDQATADARIPALLETDAALRFVSYEPALGPVDLEAIMMPGVRKICALSGIEAAYAGPDGDGRAMWAGSDPCSRLDWVIVGGETGRGARPMHPAWPRAVRDACRAADVAFFFKQWGDHRPIGPVDPEASATDAVSGLPVERKAVDKALRSFSAYGAFAPVVDRKGRPRSRPSDLQLPPGTPPPAFSAPPLPEAIHPRDRERDARLAAAVPPAPAAPAPDYEGEPWIFNLVGRGKIPAMLDGQVWRDQPASMVRGPS